MVRKTINQSLLQQETPKPTVSLAEARRIVEEAKQRAIFEVGELIEEIKGRLNKVHELSLEHGLDNNLGDLTYLIKKVDPNWYDSGCSYD